MSYIITSPFPSFNDTDGSPLNNGYVYVGSANLNPVTDPIPVYWDEALTQPAAQPIRTINGYLSRNGSPGRIYTAFVTYSLRVTNNKGALVFSDLNYRDPSTSAGSTYQQVITAIAGQTVFNLSRTYIPGTNNLFVYRNGLRLIVGQDYTETGYSQITLTAGADNGDEFVFDIGYNYDSAASVDAQDVTYKLPAMDSVFTNVEAKLSQIINVKDFGAVGDGTTDDTAAFTAAAAYSSPVQVSVPVGTYLLNSSPVASSSVSWLIDSGATFTGAGSLTSSGAKYLPLGNLATFVTATQFGAVGDGVTDDTAAIQAAIDFVAAKGGGTIDCTGGRWLIDSADLVVKNGVTLEGPWNNLGETDNLSYAQVKSAFILNSAYTIRLAQEFAGIKGMGIFRKGLTRPNSLAEATVEVANFAGKAITVGYGVSKDASDTYVGNCFVLGFEYAYYCDYNERPRIEYLSGDNTNGVYLNRVYDMVHMTGCHFWPYITTHQAWTFTGDAGWRRQGEAYFFGLGVDWGQALNCFSYGYDTGFEINGSDNVVLVNCGQDGYKDNNTYSVGYKVSGTTKNTNLIGCKSAAKHTSVLIDLTGGGTSQCVKITGGNLWACSTGTGSHVYLKRGNCIVTGGVSMFDGPTGVKTDSTAGAITIANNIFQTIGTPYALSNIENAIIHSNLFNNTTDPTTGFRFTFDNQQAAIHHTSFSSSGSNSGWHSKQAAGSATAISASPNGAQAGRVLAYFYDTSAFNVAGISRFVLRAAPSPGAVPGGHIVSTTATASATPIDRTILNEQGHFYPLTDNAQTCGASGFRWSAIWAANGTIQTSDARSKTDISDSRLGLEFINALRPVSYKWVEGGKEAVRQVYRNAQGEECSAGDDDASPAEIITESKAGTRTHWGLLAQEVKSVADAAGVDFGGWVLGNKDDQNSQQALRYDQFIAPLIKAVQELSKKVAELESK